MKIGVRFANADWRAGPDGAAYLARLAEECGVESVWAIDRVVMPRRYRPRYPYDPAGRLPGYFHDLDIADPFTWLTWVAAHTRTLRLGTGVLVLPLRPAALVAKQAATLDALSGGRLLLGVGAGWLREEFDAVGADFAGRFDVVEERVAALRTLWAGPHATHHGRYDRFDDVDCAPRPVRPTGIPIVLGGGRAGAARAGRIADGFYPARGTPDQVGELVAVARRAARDAGRDPDAIEITCGSDPDPQMVAGYARAGVHRVLLAPPGRDRAAFATALPRLVAALR